MCTRTNGVLEICQAARRRMAAMLAPIQLTMFPHEPVIRSRRRKPDREPERARQRDLFDSEEEPFREEAR